MRYAWIETERDDYPLKRLYHVLQLSRCGHYAWRRSQPSATAERRQAIARGVEQSQRDSHGTYGFRRVHQNLLDDHEMACGHETVRQVMAELGLSGK